MLRGRRNEKQNRPGLSFETNPSADIRISRAQATIRPQDLCELMTAT